MNEQLGSGSSLRLNSDLISEAVAATHICSLPRVKKCTEGHMPQRPMRSEQLMAEKLSGGSWSSRVIVSVTEVGLAATPQEKRPVTSGKDTLPLALSMERSFSALY